MAAFVFLNGVFGDGRVSKATVTWIYSLADFFFFSDDRASRWDKRRLQRQDLKGSYNNNEYGEEDSDADDIQRFVHDFDEMTG